MDGWLTEHIQDVFRLARKDTQYAEMQKTHCELEAKITEYLKSLSDETQDTFWEYICLSNAMNWRILELVLGGFPMKANYHPERDDNDFSDTAGGS